MNREFTKKDAEDLFNSSRGFREVLSEILEEKLTKKFSISEKDYDNPSWAYKQAHRLGYNQALTEVINLIKEKENNE